MTDRYDFATLSPIEFEALVADLLAKELALRFETFSTGSDNGIDARHRSESGDIIIQAKHFKNSKWADLKRSAGSESSNIDDINPKQYYFVTSQRLSPSKKRAISEALNHPSVSEATILGCTEINALLLKHGSVEKRHIKLWLSSSAVLERMLTNDISVFTDATIDGIQRVLNVYVENPSLAKAADILAEQHCLIISGPPGVGKTTLAQVLSTEYCESGWELIAINNIDEGHRSFNSDTKQIFLFDDFLGTIRLDSHSLAHNDSKVSKFMRLVSRRNDKLFVLTTRKYILQHAIHISEALDGDRLKLNEMVLDLSEYTREIKARILYNHLYHSSLDVAAIEALIDTGMVSKIVDHPHYMPRIVEWMTDHFRFKDIDPNQYPETFLQALDNPERIWEKPFRQHISSEARILLYCLFFSKRNSLFKKGCQKDTLKSYFDNALAEFKIPSDNTLQANQFVDTLRELKSSFITIDGQYISFINPSIEDFISRQLNDKDLLKSLALSVPTMPHFLAFWEAVLARFKSDGDESYKRLVAQSLLRKLESGGIDGKISLTSSVHYLEQIVSYSENESIHRTFRGGALTDSFWSSESELPELIHDLSDGYLSEYPNAALYARFFRMALYQYLSGRSCVLDLEEMGSLAENLELYGAETPVCTIEAFEDAAEESIDIIELTDIRPGDDPESMASGWIEQIDKINSFFGYDLHSRKRDDIADFVHQAQTAHEIEAEEQKERWARHSPWRGTSSLSGGLASKTHSNLNGDGFSDDDLNAMFSSLKQ